MAVTITEFRSFELNACNYKLIPVKWNSIPWLFERTPDMNATAIAYVNIKSNDYPGVSLVESHVVPAKGAPAAAKKILGQWVQGNDRIVQLPPWDAKRGDLTLVGVTYLIETDAGDLDIFAQLFME